MSTIIQAKSGDKHHVSLAKTYITAGYTGEQVLAEMKANKYTFQIGSDVIHFNAVSVVSIMTGIRVGLASNTRTVTAPLAEIEAQFKAGTLKYTKAKGLHNPKEEVA